MKKISLIITCGYLESGNKIIEDERLLAFKQCLVSVKMLMRNSPLIANDEVIISEFGEKSKLNGLVSASLKGINHKYIFTAGEKFNQSIAKNNGAKISAGDILVWINSDVLLTSNTLNVIRNRFQKNENIFCTAARHDVFLKNFNEFFHHDIQTLSNDTYKTHLLYLDDSGWQHALNIPKQKIYHNILGYCGMFANNVIQDFHSNYINYGEMLSVSRKVWEQYPFDEEVIAIVDSFYRDYIFHNILECKLELIHNEMALFHLSGSDFMQQEIVNSNKYDRLIKDLILCAEKYEYMRHGLVLSFFREFESTIEKLKIPFKEIFDTWVSDFNWKYYRDKEYVMNKYSVTHA